jgi:hypothetical protein
MGRNGCSGAQELFAYHPHFLPRLRELDEEADYLGSKGFSSISELLRKAPTFHFCFLLSTFYFYLRAGFAPVDSQGLRSLAIACHVSPE